jgi:hypothetical protein
MKICKLFFTTYSAPIPGNKKIINKRKIMKKGRMKMKIKSEEKKEKRKNK